MDLAYTAEVNNIGNYLEFTNGGIKVNKSGYYKVSCSTSITSPTSEAGTMIVETYADTTRIFVGYNYVPTKNVFTCIALTPRVQYIESNTIIKSKIACNTSGNVTVAGWGYTYLTVEFIK